MDEKVGLKPLMDELDPDGPVIRGGLFMDAELFTVFLKLIGIMLDPTPFSLSCLLSHEII